MDHRPPARFRCTAWPLALLAGASLLGGCVSLGPLPDPVQPVAAQWSNRNAVPDTPGIDPARWWAGFDDPMLDALVARTLAQNLSLAQAGHRLRAARAIVRPALAQRLPRLDANAGGHRQQRLSGPGNIDLNRSELRADGTPLLREEARASGYYQAGFDAAWEIDLFGRAAAAGDAARAAADGALADARMARVSVVAEVVRSYVELRAAQRRQALLALNLEDQNRLVALTRERRDAGIASDLEVDRSLAAAAGSAAQLPLLGQSIRQAAQRIAVLTGESTVDPQLLQPAPQPSAEHLSLTLLPADLLRVRPEIRRAEHAVAQAGAELGIAVADLYPRLILAGDLIASGNLVGTPLPGHAINATAGLSISIPLLDWGARRAVVNAREAELAAAIEGYRLAVLEGIEETENALAAVEAGRRQAAEEAIHLQATRRAAEHADMLYRRGMASRFDTLDAGIALRQAQMSGADAAEQQALAVVALHKAVGGASLEPAH